MLTKHEYKPVTSDWDKDIHDCCQTTTTGGPCGDCCYDTWSDELDQVIPAYNEALEDYNQKQAKYDFVTGRRDKYKGWLDELDKAENLARLTCEQLKLIACQSDKIWYNSCKAEQAIRILFCMIRDIYVQVDGIKAIYDDLQNCITKNTDPSLVKGQGILKYLDDYKTKLDATVKTRDDVVKNIVLAIQLSALIQNNISTRDCSTGANYNPCADDQQPCASLNGDVYYGLKTIICEWYTAFECDTDCTGSTNQGSTQQKQQGSTPQQDDCNLGCCDLVPTFEFPICNNKFRQCVQEWVDNDNKCLNSLRGPLQTAKRRKEALLACKTSLDNAVKAVDPAARCKN